MAVSAAHNVNRATSSLGKRRWRGLFAGRRQEREAPGQESRRS